MLHRFIEGMYGIDLHPGHGVRFRSIEGRQHYLLDAARVCGNNQRQHALHGNNAAIQRQFAQEQGIVQPERLQLPRRLDNGDRNGQVEHCAFLFEIRRRQIDRCMAIGHGKATVFERRRNTVAAFLDGGIRQAHHGKLVLVAAARVGLHRDRFTLNTVQSIAQRSC